LQTTDKDKVVTPPTGSPASRFWFPPKTYNELLTAEQPAGAKPHLRRLVLVLQTAASLQFHQFHLIHLSPKKARKFSLPFLFALTASPLKL
jgi:hypothetical protein